jgi:transposase
MNKLIKLLDDKLILEKYEVVDDTIYLYVKSKSSEVVCPYCNTKSNKVHSYYERSFQDLPIQGKKTIIILKNRKMFCQNQDCCKKTFAERFQCISHKSKKTKRLEDEILSISQNVSSIAASKILKKNIANISKSTICNILKKNKSSD